MLNWLKHFKSEGAGSPDSEPNCPSSTQPLPTKDSNDLDPEKQIQILLNALRDVPEAEGMALLLNRRQKTDPDAPNKFCVIIDTCFLMLNNWPSWWDEFMGLLSMDPLQCCTIVPLEVTEELQRHMENEEKSQLARVEPANKVVHAFTLHQKVSK